MLIKVAGLDPSLSNFGIVTASVDIDTLAVQPERLFLSETEKNTKKVVQQNSDDIRRAMEHLTAINREIADCMIAFAEVPVGSQNARAMCSYGVCVGLLAACPIPLIQVQPTEVKLAAVGTKTASKEEMIEWATELYPRLDWFVTTRKGVKTFGAKNEHLADAIAAIHAGIKTDEFRKLVAMWRSTAIAPQAQTFSHVQSSK